MNEIQLSKDADALICVLYKEYLQRRKQGLSKTQATSFADSDYIQRQFMTKWSVEDVDETCRELDDAGLLSCFIADDTVCETTLVNNGIIYMENRFSAGIESVFKYLEKLRSILPW